MLNELGIKTGDLGSILDLDTNLVAIIDPEDFEKSPDPKATNLDNWQVFVNGHLTLQEMMNQKAENKK